MNHVDSDDGEQAESNPMVDVHDQVLKLWAKNIANDGHQGLKQAEPQPASQCHTPWEAFGSQAFAEGYREGVHRHAYGNQQQFDKTHTWCIWVQK